MHSEPALSLIVPTRGRPAQLGCFLDSLAATLSRPDAVEVVLVVDADDPSGDAVRYGRGPLRRVVVPPGLTMGALNMAGYEASLGRHVMLLNDDVTVRTRGWDERALAALRRFPDDIVLVHVNDTLLRDRLCVFPLLSRTYCRLAGGVCPREYVRYRIDDHIEDVFNMLWALGRRRTIYFPDLVFEHHNTVPHPRAGPVYASDPGALPADDARFMALAEARKGLVLRLLEHMEGPGDPELRSWRQRRLALLEDPFYLRKPGRQRVDWSAWLRYLAGRLRQPGALAGWMSVLAERVRGCFRRKGLAGLARAAARRLVGGGVREADLRRAALDARRPAPALPDDA
jgi:hypothetical protein